MTLKDIKDVLTFAAFRPEPDNPDAPWRDRFHGRRVLLLNLSRTHVGWVARDRRGRISDAGEMPGDIGEVAEEMASSWRDLTEDGWVGVSVNSRFVISLEQNLSRKSGWRESIRSNPKVVLGSLCDRGKRYAIHHNPDTNNSLLLTVDDSMVKNVEGVLRAKNLRPARIACGLFAMTTGALETISRDQAHAQGESVVMAWAEGSICTLVFNQGGWSDLRCRSGLNPNDFDGALTMLRPYFERREKPARITVVADEQHSGFAEHMRSRFEAVPFTDLSRPHEIWDALTEG